jgi:ADP-ribose pyrophosphatase YjhB (NUDIX family)
MAWPRCGVSAVVFQGDDVLLVRRSKGPYGGLWSLPGGHIEPGEPAIVAAVREVEEETGIAAAIAGLVDFHEVLRRDANFGVAAHYVLLVFYGRWIDGEPVAGGDAAAARFVPRTTLESLALTDAAISFIERARTKLNSQIGT